MPVVKGQQVNPDNVLVPYNVRLELKTRQFLQALVQVQKLPGGQRELIGLMLLAYREKYPTATEKAIELIKLINSEN